MRDIHDILSTGSLVIVAGCWLLHSYKSIRHQLSSTIEVIVDNESEAKPDNSGTVSKISSDDEIDAAITAAGLEEESYEVGEGMILSLQNMMIQNADRMAEIKALIANLEKGLEMILKELDQKLVVT